MTQRFQALLERDEEVDATRVAIPIDVHAVFGSRARVPVRGTINGFSFRSSLFPYGGVHYLIVTRAVREGAHVKAGDTVDLVLERDDEPRIVTPPPDFSQALAANAPARDAWEKMSYSRRKELVNTIEEAKKPETRARRIDKALAELTPTHDGPAQ
ncbi:MAG: YdeI/OmpD-associated family protein [Chloroflexia bacterium]